MTINEVAPPGFGHTKGDKEKGVKKGGTAASFDKARKEGRFKGSKSEILAIMWSQKKKGDKPHYKPGTDKKYKKYQKEEMDNVPARDKSKIKGRFKTLHKKDLKGTLPEGKTWKDFKRAITAVKKGKEQKKPEKAMDAGARAKRVLARKEYAAKVSGSTENVPDDIRD